MNWKCIVSRYLIYWFKKNVVPFDSSSVHTQEPWEFRIWAFHKRNFMAWIWSIWCVFLIVNSICKICLPNSFFILFEWLSVDEHFKNKETIFDINGDAIVFNWNAGSNFGLYFVWEVHVYEVIEIHYGDNQNAERKKSSNKSSLALLITNEKHKWFWEQIEFSYKMFHLDKKLGFCCILPKTREN